MRSTDLRAKVTKLERARPCAVCGGRGKVVVVDRRSGCNHAYEEPPGCPACGRKILIVIEDLHVEPP
jgi:RecJ-like exonuclease